MRLDDLTIRDLLTSIAAKTPTPGGGAVASITAALAAALAQMVVNYSVGKKSLAAYDAMHLAALKSLGALSNKALELAEVDALAYARLNELGKLARDDARRAREYGPALDAAIEAPRAVVHTSIEMLNLMRSLVGTTNPMLNSDLAIAAVLAEAAARCAAWNVHINLTLLESASRGAEIEAAVQRDLQQAGLISASIERACS